MAGAKSRPFCRPSLANRFSIRDRKSLSGSGANVRLEELRNRSTILLPVLVSKTADGRCPSRFETCRVAILFYVCEKLSERVEDCTGYALFLSLGSLPRASRDMRA